MRPIFPLCILLLLLPSITLSAGFGWRASIVEWDKLRTARESGVSQARDLIAEQPGSEKLRLHFQIQLDNEINGRFCAPAEQDGYRVTPKQSEFFSRDFLSWAAETQRSRGVKNSIFFLFQQPPAFIKISADNRYERQRDLWFVIEPQAIETYLTELREFNAGVNAPPAYGSLARYLEGVLMLADSDRYPERANAFEEQGRSALFLCGYD